MPLILIEGCDGSGKSTLIDQLMKKYSPDNPRLIKMAFPIDRNLITEKYDNTDDQSLIKHHLKFTHEFKNKQNEMLDLLLQNYTILLDRYTMSYFVYFMVDYMSMFMKRGMSDKQLMEICKRTTTQLISRLLNRFVNPSALIYLYDSDTQDMKTKTIQEMYEVALMHIDPKAVYKVQKSKHTFETVETLLKQNKYI